MLDLHLRAISKTPHVGPSQIRALSSAEIRSNPKHIDNWINSITELHANKPPPTVTYSRRMPDIETLMQEWSPELEAKISQVPLFALCILVSCTDLIAPPDQLTWSFTEFVLTGFRSFSVCDFRYSCVPFSCCCWRCTQTPKQPLDRITPCDVYFMAWIPQFGAFQRTDGDGEGRVGRYVILAIEVFLRHMVVLVAAHWCWWKRLHVGLVLICYFVLSSHFAYIPNSSTEAILWEVLTSPLSSSSLFVLFAFHPSPSPSPSHPLLPVHINEDAQNPPHKRQTPTRRVRANRTDVTRIRSENERSGTGTTCKFETKWNGMADI